MAKRLIAYIESYNLYRGMRDAKMDSLLWLDLGALVKRLCPKDTRVAAVKYVTARILNLKQKSHPGFAEGEAGRKRQTEYIDALISTGVMVFEGKYKLRPVAAGRAARSGPNRKKRPQTCTWPLSFCATLSGASSTRQ